ncbi:MAG: acetoacetate decarboxylase family protein [Myxococcales bacterium]|nr:acetoacetate decarboxylase family protein [Myxococcales bacterium]
MELKPGNSPPKPYPAPPWDTRGRAVFVPLLTRRRDLELPRGFEPVAFRGRCTGLLAYVVYEPPSPLTYHELIWMPCMVRVKRGARHLRGYFVSFMYVDDETTLRAGRELWALPKSWADFKESARGVHVEAQDGTRISLEHASRLPAVGAKSRMATLQSSSDGVVQFRAEMTGRARLCRARVRDFSSPEPGWRSFERATRLGPVGAELTGFRSLMLAPNVLEN